MSRIATGLPALMLALWLMPVQDADAASAVRGRGFIHAAPAVHARPAVRARPVNVASWRAMRGRHEFAHSGRRFRHGFGRNVWGGPWLGSYGSADAMATLQDGGSEPEREIDRDSFENMPVRMGIPRSPEPRPVIYRIEGSKARPVVRVLRVGIEDRRAGYRHLASGEGGNAEILTLRSR